MHRPEHKGIWWSCAATLLVVEQPYFRPSADFDYKVAKWIEHMSHEAMVMVFFPITALKEKFPTCLLTSHIHMYS